MPRHVFSGGRIVTPLREMKADLVIEGGKIIELRAPGVVRPGETAIDCHGKFVGPGLVDIHVHGGKGNDFSSSDPDEITRGVAFHLSCGTTSILPSSVSIPFGDLDKAIGAARTAAKSSAATVLGYHVEGVYLNKTYRGGHLLEYVHDPDPREYEPILAAHGDFIREWTLAPELPGALNLIKACRKANIVPSAGHTLATYEEFMAAVEAGLRHTTHFACCMGNMRFEVLQPGKTTGQGYAPGVLEAVLLHDEVTSEVIADGHHLHPGLIRLIVKSKGPECVCLISDTLHGVGLPEGEYAVGGQTAIIKNGIAIIKGRPEIIASSVTPLVGMLGFAHRACGLTLVNAWEMASLTSARVIGVDERKGSLAPGKDADVLVLDAKLNVSAVWARGKHVSPALPA